MLENRKWILVLGAVALLIGLPIFAIQMQRSLTHAQKVHPRPSPRALSAEEQALLGRLEQLKAQTKVLTFPSDPRALTGQRRNNEIRIALYRAWCSQGTALFKQTVVTDEREELHRYLVIDQGQVSIIDDCSRYLARSEPYVREYPVPSDPADEGVRLISENIADTDDVEAYEKQDPELHPTPPAGWRLWLLVRMQMPKEGELQVKF